MIQTLKICLDFKLREYKPGVHENIHFTREMNEWSDNQFIISQKGLEGDTKIEEFK